jgi:hypothetical protein
MGTWIFVAVVLVVCLGVALVAYLKRDRSKDWETEEQRQKRQLGDRLERRFQEEEAERDTLPPTHES